MDGERNGLRWRVTGLRYDKRYGRGSFWMDDDGSSPHSWDVPRKIDNCGSSTNVSYWAELLNATGKAIRTSVDSDIDLCKSWLLVILFWYMFHNHPVYCFFLGIENCHNSWPDFKTGFCPMNFFRTGAACKPQNHTKARRRIKCMKLVLEGCRL